MLRSGDGLFLDNQLNGNIAARGIRVWADLVGEFDELLSGRFVYARDKDMQFDIESEAAPARWSNAHVGCNRRRASLHVLTARNLLKCGLKAGRVSGGKKLLGICALPAFAPHFFGNIQIHFKVSVRASRVSISSALDGCFSCIENLHGCCSPDR
jgi:hypothetical protein